MNRINIILNKKEQERLNRLALRFGLSLPEFGRKILTELEDSFPEESLNDYENPKKIKASLKRALKDWQTGQFSSRL